LHDTLLFIQLVRALRYVFLLAIARTGQLSYGAAK